VQPLDIPVTAGETRDRTEPFDSRYHNGNVPSRRKRFPVWEQSSENVPVGSRFVSALDDRRALDSQRCFTTKTVKDVPRQNGNDVAGLDKPKGWARQVNLVSGYCCEPTMFYSNRVPAAVAQAELIWSYPSRNKLLALPRPRSTTTDDDGQQNHENERTPSLRSLMVHEVRV